MAIATLRIWIEGPLQSWGTRSRFELRSSEIVPTKSAVIGMIANAAGWSREENLDALAAVRFGVRVIRYGSPTTDFHTVGADGDYRGVALAGGGKGRLIVTRRVYLQDAAFVVGLSSSDPDLLSTIHEVLREPRRPIYLGRKSCPPCGPLVSDDSIAASDLEAALTEDWSPLVARRRKLAPAKEMYVELEEGEMRSLDQPTSSSFSDRQFTERRFARLPIPAQNDVAKT